MDSKEEQKFQTEEENQDLTFELEGELKVQGHLNKITSHPDEETSIYKIKIELTNHTESKLQLHWGITRQPKISDWITPPKNIYPEQTEFCDNFSANTIFKDSKIVFDFELNSKDKELFQFITFVFHNLSNDKWYNNNGSNYRIELIKKEKKTNSSLDELEVPNCIKDGMNCEATYGSWCLMMRYQKVRDALFQLDLSNSNEALWVYLWLRYSFRRLLDWQRHFNTPPKDLQWSMHTLTFELTKRFADFARNQRFSRLHSQLSTER